MPYFTTITSKGQITLPAELRQKLGLSSGQKVAVSMNSQDQLVIVAPPDVDAVREKNKAYLKAQGFTPDKLRAMAENYKSGDGLTAYVKEKYAK